ncbi:MAG: hypothetical protein H7836_04705 [Magnetococcus sp. YQC-3]
MHILHFLQEAFNDANQNPITQPNDQIPGQEEPPIETGLDPVSAQELEFDSLKKYIIYNKVRELKEQLENSKIVISDDYRKVLYFINIVLNFFDIFEYDQLVGMVDSIVTKIEKLETI